VDGGHASNADPRCPDVLNALRCSGHRSFRTRGRVLIPPEDLGPKGDLNDWLRVRAKGDLAAFRSVLEQALAMSPTPWALQIQRLPSDLATWDLEDYPGVRDLLCELGPQGPLSRDAHPRLLAEWCGVKSLEELWKSRQATSRALWLTGLAFLGRGG
jgi:hypothetical protein